MTQSLKNLGSWPASNAPPRPPFMRPVMSRWTNLAEQRRRALRAAAKSVNSGSGLQIAKAESRRASCPVNTAETFLRGVGSLYPEPIKVSGKGKRWLREVLD